MQEIEVAYRGKRFQCKRYGDQDVAELLDRFFFWKASAFLAEKTGTRRPQLPSSFSEPFVCYLLSLAHNPGNGPDAFKITHKGDLDAVVEIKATITDSGFTDVRRDLSFDVCYWLSLENYGSLKYSIYRLDKSTLKSLSSRSRTPRERATVGLEKLVRKLHPRPAKKGHIGVVEE